MYEPGIGLPTIDRKVPALAMHPPPAGSLGSYADDALIPEVWPKPTHALRESA